MKGKEKVLVVLFVVLIVSLAACRGTKADGVQKTYTIATVVKDMSDPWCLRHEEGVLEFAKATGLSCYVKGPPKTDSAQQIQVMEELIAQSIDALCVVPIDPEACEPVLKRA
ncbi:MAG: substrate-binding domain-containing protein, partial [Treponema sp.]|nr:substrate-binding domain-containing protein [Treponema sp.]